MAWNPALKAIDNDVLYHFGLNTNDHNMKEMFGDVKVNIYVGCDSILCPYILYTVYKTQVVAFTTFRMHYMITVQYKTQLYN